MLITFASRDGTVMEMPVLDPNMAKGRFVVEMGGASDVRIRQEIDEDERPVPCRKKGLWEIQPVDGRWYHASVWTSDREGEPDYVFSFKHEGSQFVFCTEVDWAAGAPEVRIAMAL